MSSWVSTLSNWAQSSTLSRYVDRFLIGGVCCSRLVLIYFHINDDFDSLPYYLTSDIANYILILFFTRLFYNIIIVLRTKVDFEGDFQLSTRIQFFAACVVSLVILAVTSVYAESRSQNNSGPPRVYEMVQVNLIINLYIFLMTWAYAPVYTTVINQV